MGDTGLPAPKRLESWTRDRKLWSHISEQHVAECWLPCVCSYPLCNVILEDAAALQFHLVDEHGLTQRGQTVAAVALDSQDEAILIDENRSNGYESRKRKGLSKASSLEWMPPPSFPDVSTALAEPSPRRPSKRSRRVNSTVCPAVLSLDYGTSHKQATQDLDHRLDSVMLYPAFSLENSDKELTPDVAMPESDLAPTADGVVDSIEAEGSDDSPGFQSLFDLYLRSPTTSPSPADTAKELSGTTLAVSEQRLSSTETGPSKSPEEGEAPCQAALSGSVNFPRIRLRVHQPKITLNLRIPKQNKHGSGSLSKGHHRADEKKEVESKRPSQSKKNHQRRRKVYHRSA